MGAHRCPLGCRPPLRVLLAATLLVFGCSEEAGNDGGIVGPKPPPKLETPHIAFVSNRGGSVGIHLYDPATGTVVRLSPAGAYDTAPAISPDGTRIAFEHYSPDGRFRLMTMAVDGSDRQTCTDDSAASDADPHWSPDSRYIAFARTNRESGARDIYAVRRDGLMLARITNDGRSTVLDWSPDGTRLLIVRHVYSWPNLQQDVQTLDTATRAATSLFGPTVRNYVGGDYSPDGRRIVLSVGFEGSSAYLLGTDSTVSFQRWMLQDAGFSSLGHPSWSPDGAWITFSGDDDLFTVTWRYENLESVLIDPPMDWDPDWGPKP